MHDKKFIFSLRDRLNTMLMRLFPPRLSLSEVEKHIDAIVQEVTWINHYADIRRQFYDIVNQSSVGGERNEFWSLVHLSFAHELIIRLNRLYDRQFEDPDQHVYSLQALLLSLRADPNLLSREHYLEISPCTEKRWRETLKGTLPDGTVDMFNFYRLNKEFDKMAGTGESIYSKTKINKDLKDLKKAMGPLKTYRNKVLAHNAKNKTLPAVVTHDDIANAVNVVTEIARKYFLLIRRGSHALNVAPPNITKLFMKPWISSESARKAILDKFKLDSK